MARKEKISAEVKIEFIEKYFNGEISVREIAKTLDLCISSVWLWVQNYKIFGRNGLITKNKNKYYSSEVKYQAIAEYLSGMSSLADICVRYEITSSSILRKWIKNHLNGHNAVNVKYRGDCVMNKGRKTTYEEKIEIVSFCISSNNNYSLTAAKYNISYQQIYTWTKKYQTKGLEGLSDKRGKRIIKENITELDKIKSQIKLLEAQNIKLKMENDFLKKLEQLEKELIK